MKKTLLPLLLLLALTACNERKYATMPSPSVPEPTIAAEPEIETNIDTIKKPEVNHTTTVQPTVETTIQPTIQPAVKPKTKPKVKTNTKSKVETFAGGTMTDGLDMGIIRLGKEGQTTRLVFDSFKWNSNARTPSIRSHDSGSYTFRYNPQNRRITAIVNGYRSFSALQMGKARLFGSNEMVRKIYLEKYLDDSAYKFTIELKKNAKVNVFELKGPGRIIVDISPL